MSFTYITGSGTQADPYVITDKNGWDEFASYVTSGNRMSGEYVELGADIDFQSTDINNIAHGMNFNRSSSSQVGNSSNPFCGNFNGNHHILNRFYCCDYRIFYTSGNVVIKNVAFLNVYGNYTNHAPIFYMNIDVVDKTPVFDSIVYTTTYQANSNTGGSFLYINNPSDMGNGYITIKRCIVKTKMFAIGNYYLIYIDRPNNSTHPTLRINCDSCILINFVFLYKNYYQDYYFDINISKMLVYFVYFSGNERHVYEMTLNESGVSVNDSYVSIADNVSDVKLKQYFPTNKFTYISYNDCINQQTFTNWNFTTDFDIDYGFDMPIPKTLSNRYVCVDVLMNGNNNDRQNYQMIPIESTGNYAHSSGFCRVYGQWNIMKKGNTFNLGIDIANTSQCADYPYNITQIKNLNNNHIGPEIITYENIQTRLLIRYEIKPNLNGYGTQESPYLISSYNDLRVYIFGFYNSQMFSEPYYVGNGGARNVYFELQNDIICNDISNFNNWRTTAPTNNINQYSGYSHYGSGGILNGNNHKIIGLYAGSTTDWVFRFKTDAEQTIINDVKFDYIYGAFLITGSTGTNYSAIINNCEFNGIPTFLCNSYGGLLTINNSLINRLPTNDNLTSWANTLNSNEYGSSYTLQLSMNNCIINGAFFTLYHSYLRTTFTNCIFTGLYYKVSHNYSTSYSRGVEFPTFVNCYMLENCIINKENVNGLTYIDNATYVSGNLNLDFTNTFQKNYTSNSHGYGETQIILKNMPQRFTYCAFLNEWSSFSNTNCGLTSITPRYYMSSNDSINITVTVTPDSFHKMLKWSDENNESSYGISFRSILTSFDKFISYKLVTNIALNGHGSKDNPYLITSKEDLVTVSNFYKNGYSTNSYIHFQYTYYKLTNDITFQDYSSWESWETSEPSESFTPILRFSGCIDGDGHTIFGLYNKDTTYNMNGTFLNHVEDVTLKNLRIANSVFKIVSTNLFCGGFVCTHNYNYNTQSIEMENCRFSGTIINNTSANAYPICGLFACYNIYRYIIRKCKFDGKIKHPNTNPQYIGFIYQNDTRVDDVYTSYDRSIIECVNSGTIEITGGSNKSVFSGILRYSDVGIDILVERCYNKSSIQCDNNINIYGIVHQDNTSSSSTSIVSNCYNVGDFVSNNSNSIIVGIATSKNITNCYNYGNLTNSQSNNTFAISYNPSYSNVSGCYYLENTASNSGGGTSLTAENFILPTSLVGFDFVNTWIVDQSAGRPKLINNYEGSSSSLIVTSSNPNYGTVSGGGDYDYGEIAVITATPFAGCEFIVWSDGKRTNPREIVVNRNMMFQAMFKGEYPIRVLDYYGLITFLTDLKTFIATNMATKVDKTQSGDYNTPVYFNSSGVPTPCTELDLDTSGNAGTATKLETARKINTVEFDGTTDITITPTNIGLGNVDNTSDMDKPISTATQNALTVLADDITGITYDNITYQMIDDIFNE